MVRGNYSRLCVSILIIRASLTVFNLKDAAIWGCRAFPFCPELKCDHRLAYSMSRCAPCWRLTEGLTLADKPAVVLKVQHIAASPQERKLGTAKDNGALRKCSIGVSTFSTLNKQPFNGSLAIHDMELC